MTVTVHDSFLKLAYPFLCPRCEGQWLNQEDRCIGSPSWWTLVKYDLFGIAPPLEHGCGMRLFGGGKFGWVTNHHLLFWDVYWQTCTLIRHDSGKRPTAVPVLSETTIPWLPYDVAEEKLEIWETFS